jgi:hypothetical protein
MNNRGIDDILLISGLLDRILINNHSRIFAGANELIEQ